MASKIDLYNYSSTSYEGLVDSILELQEQLAQAQDTIGDQADLIVELQEQIAND